MGRYQKPRAVFRLLPAGGAACGQGYVSGSYGEAVTFARAATKLCHTGSGVVSVASGSPCVEPRGLLVEHATTNICLRSSTFTNASWVLLTGATGSVSDNAVTSPLGTTTASTFTEGTGAGNANGLYQSVTFTAAPYTLSIYAKAGTGRYFTLALNNTVDDGAKFDLQTGTLIASGASITAARIEFVGNGWYRLSITRTMSAASEYPEFWTEQNGSTTITRAGTGTGLTFHIWHAQVQTGTVVSSPIPTAGASASGVADRPSVSASTWPTASGRISFTLATQWSTAPAVSIVLQTLSGADGLQAYINGTTLVTDYYNPALAGTVTSLNSGALTWVPGMQYRIRLEWGTWGGRIFRNDVLVGSTATSCTLAAHGVGTAHLLQQNGAQELGGWLSDLKVQR